MSNSRVPAAAAPPILPRWKARPCPFCCNARATHPARALPAIDCEVEEIVERHSDAIVIGRVLELQVSTRTAALAYWHGQYVAIDQNEDAIRLAEVSLPAPRGLWQG